MSALSTQSVGRRRILVVAAGVALALGAAPAHAADNKGLLHRIGKVEECVFGTQHKDKPLHQRISELEAQTAGGEQNGPLAKRMDALEKSITGDASGNSAIATAQNKRGGAAAVGASACTTITATAKRGAVKGKRSAADARQKSTTKTAVAAPTPVPTTTSDYMPPIAPQLDPSAGTPASVATKEEAKPEIDEMLRHGTAAFQAGNTGEAERAFREVLAKSPFNSNACFNLGAIAEQKGDLAAALGNYRTALIGSPNDSQIREAISQIEAQIAQKQDSPFHNPIAGTANGAPILQGSATDYSLQTSGGYVQAPPLVGNVPAVPPLSAATQQVSATGGARRGIWQQAAVAGLSIGGSMARTAIRSGISGGGGGSIGSALLQTGLRTGIRAGLGSFGGFLGPLHCPICRIIP